MVDVPCVLYIEDTVSDELAGSGLLRGGIPNSSTYLVHLVSSYHQIVVAGFGNGEIRGLQSIVTIVKDKVIGTRFRYIIGEHFVGNSFHLSSVDRIYTRPIAI